MGPKERSLQQTEQAAVVVWETRERWPEEGKGRENVEEQKGGTLSHFMNKAFVWGCASVWGTPTLQLVNQGTHD